MGYHLLSVQQNFLKIHSLSSDKENSTEMWLLSKFIAASLVTITTPMYNSTINTLFHNLVRSSHDQVARVNSYKISKTMETPFLIKIIVYPSGVGEVGAAS